MGLLDGRVAIVTGAGGGIGRAHALALAAEGARVVVNDIGVGLDGSPAGGGSAAQGVVDEIVAAGGRALLSEHPVDDEAAVEDMITAAVGWQGHLDALICNAGVVEYAPFAEMSPAVFRRVIETNLYGTAYVVHSALPHMIARGYGRIVLTGSQVGLYGMAANAAYGASKGAMVGLARSVAHDLDGLDISVNVIIPAAYTRMSEDAIPSAASEMYSPFNVAPVAAWLASRSCPARNVLVHTGAGQMSIARIVETPGVSIQDEDVQAAYEQLDLTAPQVEPTSANDAGALLMRHLMG